MFGDEWTINSAGGYRPNIIDIYLRRIRQFEHDPLKRSRAKRHPNQIARNHAHAIGSRIRKGARVVVGKIDGYFSELHVRLQVIRTDQ